MGVPLLVWVLTILAILGLLLFDFVFHVRAAHSPSLGEAAIWSAVYVTIAILFGVGAWLLGGAMLGREYFASYITEKALSVDNLFVFLIIMASFKVPRAAQQKALLFGIAFSLLARTVFIFIGAVLVNSYAVRVLAVRIHSARQRRSDAQTRDCDRPIGEQRRRASRQEILADLCNLRP